MIFRVKEEEIQYAVQARIFGFWVTLRKCYRKHRAQALCHWLSAASTQPDNLFNRKQYKFGDELIIDVFQPEKGKFPIGKTEAGMVCRLALGPGIRFVPYGCTAKVTVLKVHTNHLEVLVDEIVRTPEENEKIMASKIEALKNKFDGKSQNA